MKTNLIISWGILLLFLSSEIIGQQSSASKIKYYNSFNQKDFEEITSTLKYGFKDKKQLNSIVLLNSFDEIIPKFKIGIQTLEDSIEFIMVSQDGNGYRIRDFGSSYNYDENKIQIDYFKNEDDLYFKYRKYLHNKIKQEILADSHMIEFLNYRNDTITIKRVEKLSQQITYGKYKAIKLSPPDTLIRMSLFDYSEQVSVIRSKTKKIGVWQTFDQKGNLLFVKEY